MSLIASSGLPEYVAELRGLNAIAVASGGLPPGHIELTHRHLNGGANAAVRQALTVRELRETGTFFTGEPFAKEAVHRIQSHLDSARIVDPCCGCGDLLLAAANALPMDADLETTLARWGQVLHGIDQTSEFVDATRERLVMLALAKGARPAQALPPNTDELLPGIRVGNGRSPESVGDASVVLLNPPYGQVVAPRGLRWGSGRITEAGLWVIEVLNRLSSQGRAVAILPDVLRAGSRYARWRAEVASIARIGQVESLGQFDAATDVDVFLVDLERRSERRTSAFSWPTPSPGDDTLEAICRISVGPVVDRRDPHEGPSVAYITTRELPQYGDYRPARERQSNRPLFRPPFLVVRRTSRPTVSEARLRPVLIRGTRSVAVENHLVVLEPRIRSLAECRRLAVALASPWVTAWLNERLRMRHLTVVALRELPLSPT